MGDRVMSAGAAAAVAVAAVFLTFRAWHGSRGASINSPTARSHRDGCRAGAAQS